MDVNQGEKTCVLCNGAGRILRLDGAQTGETDTWKRCSCSFARVFKQRVGVEIATSVSIKESPLFTPGAPGSPPEVDRTKSNLFLKGWWSDLLPHFKYVFAWKQLEYDLNYYVQVVTDERLKDVYVGNAAYDKRSKKNRDEAPTYNSLGDLVGSDQHLVIIRLGFLGNRNRAMPGLLKEALLLRQAANMPTWIVETPDSIFGYGHFAYSEDTADYIEGRFEAINLTRDRGTEIRPRGVEGAELDDDEPGMAVDREERSSPPVKMPKERFTAPVESVPDEVMGTSRPSSKKWKKGNRNGNGGSDIV